MIVWPNGNRIRVRLWPRTVGALALAALAVIHVVDLPGTLGPTPLVGIGYLGIIVAALLISGVLIARPHWPVWAATASARAASLTALPVVTRASLPTGTPTSLPAGTRPAPAARHQL